MFKSSSKNKDIDFLSVYLASDKKSFAVGQYYKYIIPPVCLLLLFGGGFTFLKFQEIGIQKDLDSVKEEIASFDKNNADNKTDEKYALLQENQKQVSVLKENADKVNSYPQLSKEIVNTILKITNSLDLKTMNYNQQTGELNLVVETENVSQTNEFVRSLRDSGLFANVKYSGYTENKQSDTTTSIDPTTGQLQENTTTTKLAYTVNVACVLKEGS